jgi:cysteinyl-tRNA synthetase
VRELLGRRAVARKKEWARSDSLRDQLLAMGWRIKDTKEGQKVSRRG